MPLTLEPPAVAPRAAEAADPTIVFPNGLVGCESWKRFILLVAEDEDLPVATLQSVDDPSVTLLVTDPTLVLPDYRARLSAEDRSELGLESGVEPVLYCTLTVGTDGWVTANLLGPLVINPITRSGRQIVLADAPYSVRHPVARIAEDQDACSS